MKYYTNKGKVKYIIIKTSIDKSLIEHVFEKEGAFLNCSSCMNNNCNGAFISDFHYSIDGRGITRPNGWTCDWDLEEITEIDALKYIT